MKMRVLTPYELATMTRPELEATLHRLAQELPLLAEGSAALRAAHVNLNAIRRALSGPRPSGFGSRP
jgi:hypothetical protein